MVCVMALFKKEDPNLKQLTKNLSVSFSNIKKDIDEHKAWLEHLHTAHEALTQCHHTNKAEHDTQLNHMQKWIHYLHAFQQTQQTRLANLEHSLHLTITAYNTHITALYKKLATVPILDKDALKKEILKDFNHIPQRETMPALPVQAALKAIPEATLTSQRLSLSNPEQKLVSILFNGDHPLSYEHLVQKTGKNINTLRVIMNSLKKHNLIEQNVLPNGVKVFNIANKEKIKRLYNVEVL